MVVSFWIFLDQICPKLIKVDQNWSNLIKLDSSPIKKCYYYFWFFGSDMSNFLARNSFLAVMAFLQKLLFLQKYFCQIWSGFLARNGFFGLKWLFPNESALLLKVLKGLARLWWLKAFRLVDSPLCYFFSNESVLLLKVLKGLARL